MYKYCLNILLFKRKVGEAFVSFLPSESFMDLLRDEEQ